MSLRRSFSLRPFFAAAALLAAPGLKAAPVAAISTSAPGGNPTAYTPGMQAWVADQPGCTYAWSTDVGTITAGQGSSRITLTPGPAYAPMDLVCTVTDAAGASTTGSLTVYVWPNAQIGGIAWAAPGSTGNTAYTGFEAGGTYAWTIANGTLTAGQGTNQVTYTAGTSGPVQLGLTVTVGGRSGSGTRSVELLRPLDATITAPAGVTAQGAPAQASVPVQPGTSYFWSLSNGSITAGQGAAQATFIATDPGTATLTCTVTHDDGSHISGSRSVAVAPNAAVTAAAQVTAGRAGALASVPAQAGATYAWTIGNGTITAGQGTRQVTWTPGTAGSATLGCTVSAAGQAASGTQAVSVLAAPVATVTAEAGITALSTGHTASVPAQTGATYAWTLTGGTLTAGQGTRTITYTAGLAGTLRATCTVTNAAGAAATGSGSVAVSPSAAPTVPAQVYTGSTGNVATVPTQSGATYAWTVNNGTITAGQGTARLTFSAGAPGPVTVACTVTQAGLSSQGSATLQALADARITTAAAATTGTTGHTASVPVQAGAAYAWTLSGGSITAGQGTNSITWTAGAVGTATLGVTVTPSGGSGATGTRSVSVVAAPNATITATSPVLTGTAGLSASVPVQAGSTYAWTLSGGTLTAGQGTRMITYTAGAAGTATLACTVTNAAGTAAAGTKKVGVSATSATIWPSASTITSGATNLTAQVAPQSGATYVWTISGGTITNGRGTYAVRITAGAPGTLVLGCTVTPAGGAASVGSKSITVLPAPVAGILVDSPVLAGAAGLVASVYPQAGCTYAWTLSGGTITAGQGTSAVTWTAGPAGAAVLGCTVKNAAGTSAVGNRSVEVVASGTAIYAESAVTAGSGAHWAMVPTQPGAAYAWTLSGGTITSGQGTRAVTWTAGAVGTATLGVTVTPSGGSPATGSKSVAVLAAPSATLTADDVVLVGAAGYQASVPAAGSGATYTWTVTNGTITAGQGTPTLTYTPTSAGTLKLSCKVDNGAGGSATGTRDLTSVTILDPIVVRSVVTTGTAGVVATAPRVPAGATYAWTVTGGTLGAGQGTRAITWTAGAPGSARIGLVLTPQGGSAQSAAKDVEVAPHPQVPAISAPAYVDYMGSVCTAQVAPQAGMSYRWTAVNASLPQSTTSDSAAFLPLALGTVQLSCTVTNHAGETAIGSLNLQAVARPLISSFSSASPVVSVGGATTLSASYTNGTGVVAGLGGLPSGGSLLLTTGALTADRTYTLTVTNQAGSSATATLTVRCVPGVFTLGAHPIVHRQGHTLTPLADGRILVVGGQDTAGQPLGSVEFYDPAQGFSQAPGALLYPRTGHATFPINDGWVLVVGGKGSNGLFVRTCEIYNPVDGRAVEVGTFATDHLAAAIARMADGRILVAGGSRFPSGNITAAAEILNPLMGTNIVSAAGSMSHLREWATASLLPDGRVLVAGGDYGSPHATTEVFDPSAPGGGAFSDGPDLLEARTEHTATTLPDGRILLTGGWGVQHALSSAELYDPAQGRFIAAGATATPRYLHAAALLADGRVLVTGGAPTAGAPLASAEVYDPSRGWILLAPMNLGRRGHAAIALGQGALVTGGAAGSAQDTAERFDPQH